MDVRYSQEPEVGMVLKNGLKESKEVKDSQGSLSKTLLKEPQDSFSSSGAMENCEKGRTSTGDPDYCRRILVRGKSVMFLHSDLTTLRRKSSLNSGGILDRVIADLTSAAFSFIQLINKSFSGETDGDVLKL